MRKMILDIDTGIDDAQAIAYAAASAEVELIGVIGSYGNVKVTEAVQNSINLLDMLGCENVPVFQGESQPLEADGFEVFEISRVIHGKDGIGELYLDNSKRKAQEKKGVDFLIEAAKKYKEELVIVATGPMTNLAAAIKKDEAFKEFGGKIVIMGGAVTVPGNCGPFSEANMSQDAEAAAILFDSGLDITMVGLDVTLRTLFTKEQTKIWRAIGTKAAIAYADMTDYYIDAYAVTAPHLGGCALHDPLAVAAAIEPELLQTHPMYLKVYQNIEREDYGRTTGDPERLSLADPNVKVAIGVDAARFITLFVKRLSSLFEKCE